jgi:hypothetical protein
MNRVGPILICVICVVALLTPGCGFTAAHLAPGQNPSYAADWPTAYTRPDTTLDQLNADGLDCQWSARKQETVNKTKTVLGSIAGGTTLVPGVAAPTASAHAACMKAKGYTLLRLIL